MATENNPDHITFRYVNWRGEIATRRVKPLRIWFGESEWHNGAQWFLEAIDLEKGETRDFALLDISFLK